LVFHFIPITGLCLMRLAAGRARLPASDRDRGVTPRNPAAPASTSPDSKRWARCDRPQPRCAAGPSAPLYLRTYDAATRVSVNCDETRLPSRSVAKGPRLTRKDTSMGKLAWQIIGVGAPTAAAFVARKTLTFAWEKSTKRPAPSNPVDDEVSMSEALAWTIVSGVGVAVAQLVVQRIAANTVRNSFGEEALPKKFRKQAEEISD